MTTSRSAAIYVRFSNAQANELKIEDQFAMCLSLAEQHGYSVAEDAVYVDHGVSAKDGKNRLAKLGKLMVDIQAGRYVALIMQNQDRLAREDELTSKLAKLCASKGVKLLTNEGEVDPSTSIGRFVVGLRGLLAQMEIMRKSERQVGRQARQHRQRRAGRGCRSRSGPRYVACSEAVGARPHCRPTSRDPRGPGEDPPRHRAHH